MNLNLLKNIEGLELLGVRGLVGFRTWKTVRNGYLYSTAIAYGWEDSELYADTKPTFFNQNGFYFYGFDKLNNACSPLDYAAGIVEARGDIVEHEDGIMRAEWMKILKLFIHGEFTNDYWIKLNYNIYKVPIVLTDSIEQSLKHWVETKGKVYIERNKTLLGQSPCKTLEEADIKVETWKEQPEHGNDEIVFPVNHNFAGRASAMAEIGIPESLKLQYQESQMKQRISNKVKKHLKYRILIITLAFLASLCWWGLVEVNAGIRIATESQITGLVIGGVFTTVSFILTLVSGAFE